MPTIRPYQPSDWPALWLILQATFATGDTYAFAPTSSEAEIQHAWITLPTATFVMVDATHHLLGTYFIKPNQTGLGAHVCNCGYVVARDAQGQGIAAQLCEHSQSYALSIGFSAMQFNLVVATNLRAVQLWQRLGFATIGTLPKAFNHQQLGLVDALVMYKILSSD